MPDPDGYAWADLTTLATRLGWHVRVEPAQTPSLGQHVQAMVWSSGRFSIGGSLKRLSTRSRGATEEDALAEALARMLRRVEADFG